MYKRQVQNAHKINVAALCGRAPPDTALQPHKPYPRTKTRQRDVYKRQMMVKLGNVDKVLYYLRKREEYCHSEIYSDVESDPRCV